MFRNTFFAYCVLNIFSAVLVDSYYVVQTPKPVKERATLRLIFSLSRHGDSIQEVSYPKDPYINVTYFPQGLGQVTNNGIRRSFNLGQTLRKNYRNFLGPLYYGGIVQARSTDYDRTKSSLMATLAGLFSPHPINVWSNEDELAKRWLPIPFAVSPRYNDTIMWGTNCPNANKLYQEYKQTPDYQNTFAKYNMLFDFIEKYTGINITDLSQVRSFLYVFNSQENYGLEVPEWARLFYPDQLTDALVDGYYALSATPDLRKYTTGFFFKEMIGEIQKKMAGTLDKGRKIYVYTGHDPNIGNTMVTLGIMYGHYPKFCENLTFEVHEIKGEYYVRILHQEFLNVKPRAVRIPECPEYCHFRKFVKYLSDFFPGPEDTCFDMTF